MIGDQVDAIPLNDPAPLILLLNHTSEVPARGVQYKIIPNGGVVNYVSVNYECIIHLYVSVAMQALSD